MPAYSRLPEGDEFPLDAVIVAITDDPDLPDGNPIAEIRRPATLLGDRFMAAADEGPYSVPEALRTAEEIRNWLGFERILISIEDPDRWNPEWGKLR